METSRIASPNNALRTKLRRCSPKLIHLLDSVSLAISRWPMDQYMWQTMVDIKKKYEGTNTKSCATRHKNSASAYYFISAVLFYSIQVQTTRRQTRFLCFIETSNGWWQFVVSRLVITPNLWSISAGLYYCLAIRSPVSRAGPYRLRSMPLPLHPCVKRTIQCTVRYWHP